MTSHSSDRHGVSRAFVEPPPRDTRHEARDIPRNVRCPSPFSSRNGANREYLTGDTESSVEGLKRITIDWNDGTVRRLHIGTNMSRAKKGGGGGKGIALRLIKVDIHVPRANPISRDPVFPGHFKHQRLPTHGENRSRDVHHATSSASAYDRAGMDDKLHERATRRARERAGTGTDRGRR